LIKLPWNIFFSAIHFTEISGFFLLFDLMVEIQGDKKYEENLFYHRLLVFLFGIAFAQTGTKKRPLPYEYGRVASQ
jgi:hypothetical protein